MGAIDSVACEACFLENGNRESQTSPAPNPPHLLGPCESRYSAISPVRHNNKGGTHVLSRGHMQRGAREGWEGQECDG